MDPLHTVARLRREGWRLDDRYATTSPPTTSTSHTNLSPVLVMVEREEITGLINVHTRDASESNLAGASAPKFTGHKLYTEYLRREGRAAPPSSDMSSVLSSPVHPSGSVRGARPTSAGYY